MFRARRTKDCEWSTLCGILCVHLQGGKGGKTLKREMGNSHFLNYHPLRFAAHSKDHFYQETSRLFPQIREHVLQRTSRPKIPRGDQM